MIWRRNGHITPYHLRNHWANKRFKPDCAGGDQDARYYIACRIQERLSQLEQIDVPVAEPDNKPFRWYGVLSEDTTNSMKLISLFIERSFWSMTSSIRVVRLRCHWTISHGQPARVSLHLVDRGHWSCRLSDLLVSICVREHCRDGGS